MIIAESGVMFLKTNIEERACDLAAYIIESRATVRAAAKRFGVSKSTVHTVIIIGVALSR
jgi:hypothetical protein